jgi:hypothetical protein
MLYEAVAAVTGTARSIITIHEMEQRHCAMDKD